MVRSPQEVGDSLVTARDGSIFATGLGDAQPTVVDSFYEARARRCQISGPLGPRGAPYR